MVASSNLQNKGLLGKFGLDRVVKPAFVEEQDTVLTGALKDQNVSHSGDIVGTV